MRPPVGDESAPAVASAEDRRPRHKRIGPARDPAMLSILMPPSTSARCLAGGGDAAVTWAIFGSTGA
jgi:hypothetical protein